MAFYVAGLFSTMWDIFIHYKAELKNQTEPNPFLKAGSIIVIGFKMVHRILFGIAILFVQITIAAILIHQITNHEEKKFEDHWDRLTWFTCVFILFVKHFDYTSKVDVSDPKTRFVSKNPWALFFDLAPDLVFCYLYLYLNLFYTFYYSKALVEYILNILALLWIADLDNLYALHWIKTHVQPNDQTDTIGPFAYEEPEINCLLKFFSFCEFLCSFVSSFLIIGIGVLLYLSAT